MSTVALHLLIYTSITHNNNNNCIYSLYHVSEIRDIVKWYFRIFGKLTFQVLKGGKVENIDNTIRTIVKPEIPKKERKGKSR
jgi:hypothetical protein